MQKASTLNFTSIQRVSLQIADHIKKHKKQLVNALTQYETHQTANDEIERTLDLLTNLEENRTYFKKRIGPVAVFMPSNQPLYSFACFAIVPALMAERVCVKAPEVMNGFYASMLEVLDIKTFLPTIEHLQIPRNECLRMFIATKLNLETNKRDPVFDAVIFTGTTENADRLRRKFHRSTLFITNGSGHNPVVITATADIDKAIDGIMSVRTYNQGQDCAAPNSILVHKDVYEIVVERIRVEIKNLVVGRYDSPKTDIGPISRPETLPAIETFLTENSRFLDSTTDGVIRTRSSIVEPTLITKPLRKGPNFMEVFAPVFIVQKYDKDDELSQYFEDEQYANNAMYITIYGSSPYIRDFLASPKGKKLHNTSTILFDTDLHKPGIERGVQPYGGNGKGASYISKDGHILCGPTLPQREFFKYLVQGEPLVTSKQKPIGQPLKNSETAHDTEHWSQTLAKRIIDKSPHRDIYLCATGISPSGPVHFGKFRDVFTSFAVTEAIKKRGKKARLVLYWDDFDRLSEIPQSVKPSFKQYIGLPYSKVPSPDVTHASYADKYKTEFTISLKALGIEPEFISQSDAYQSGIYDELIIKSLQHRMAIADILLSSMPEQTKVEKSIIDSEYREQYYPVVVYSRFTGKDNTRVLDYDGESTITYKCYDTGRTDIIDITKEHIVKLAWRVDWPMRWAFNTVAFEPGGPDHATPGGSFDTAKLIAKDVFGIEAPLFQSYEYVGLQGGQSKLSSTKDTVTLDDLLQVYSPEILKWMYANRLPGSTFTLSLGKDIFRQNDEFDQALAHYSNASLTPNEVDALLLSGVPTSQKTAPRLSFRQLLGYGQIVQWDTRKLEELLRPQGFAKLDRSLKERFIRTQKWIEKYNQAEAITILNSPNRTYASTMTKDQITHIAKLREYIMEHDALSIDEFETIVYAIPHNRNLSMDELKKVQKSFFKDVYNLILGQNTGPRLSTFLWATDKNILLTLLDKKEPSK